MVKKSNVRNCLGIWMFLLSMVGLTQAATITVGPPQGGEFNFNTIQAGIDTAIDGDMVLVAPGEYMVTEPITFRGKAITIRSEAGPNETTIRMGTPANINRGSVFIFENGETTDSVLEGFKITEGKGIYEPSENASMGGGIFCDFSSATVSDCIIAQNSVDGSGGGIYCAHQCSPILIDCTIVENVAENSGGGVTVGYGASMTMTNCTIRGNSAEGTVGHSGAGGGVLCAFDSSMTMTYCTIVENYAAQIARKVGRQITVLEPLLDAHLEEGDRANATLIPVSSRGNTITLRKFSRDPFTITHFLKFKTMTISANVGVQP